MANAFERFFDDALTYAPPIDLEQSANLPRPNFPESPLHRPETLLSSNDRLTPLEEDSWRAEVARDVMVRGADVPRLTPEENALIDGGLRVVGFEILAFYKSRRHLNDPPFPNHWGIFFIRKGVHRVADLLRETYPGHGPTIPLALEFLRQHERYHLFFDLWALSIDAALRQNLYQRLKIAFRDHAIHQVEEALANRAAWDWAKQTRIGLNEFATDFLKIQPGAYSRFDEPKLALSSELAAHFFDCNFKPGASRYDQAHFVANAPDSLTRKSLCPEYIVDLAALAGWIDPAYNIPTVRTIIDSKKVKSDLAKTYQTIRKKWETTKEKLLKDPSLPGLQFKPWPSMPGTWSVRIDLNFRAHLRPQGRPNDGVWETASLGPHKVMGHG